jgi:hypothetical protein
MGLTSGLFPLGFLSFYVTLHRFNFNSGCDFFNPNFPKACLANNDLIAAVFFRIVILAVAKD